MGSFDKNFTKKQGSNALLPPSTTKVSKNRFLNGAKNSKSSNKVIPSTTTSRSKSRQNSQAVGDYAFSGQRIKEILVGKSKPEKSKSPKKKKKITKKSYLSGKSKRNTDSQTRNIIIEPD